MSGKDDGDRLSSPARAGRHGHARADRRNLHLHQVVFEKLRRRPELLASALELLERWLADERLRPSRRWLEEWREMLRDWPLERIADLVLEPEKGQVLRQCSPLGPVLTPEERWDALREINERMRVENEMR